MLGLHQLNKGRAMPENAGDYNAVGMTPKNTRDMLRAAALRPGEGRLTRNRAESRSTVYRQQLKRHVRKGIREVDETLLYPPSSTAAARSSGRISSALSAG